MMHLIAGLGRRLWRDRRRAGLCFTLLCLAGVLEFNGVPGTYLGMAFPIGAAVAFAAGMTPVLLAVGMLIPSWRSVAEVTAAAFLTVAIAGFYDTRLGLDEAMSGQAHSLWLFFVALAFIGQLYTSTVLDGWLAHAPYSSFRGRSSLPAQRLWDGIVGDLSCPERLADADSVVLFEPLVPGQPHRRLVQVLPNSMRLEEHQFVETSNAPHFHKMRWHSPDYGSDAPWCEGVRTTRIIDRGNDRLIVIGYRPRALAWRLVLFAWVDDAHGRTLDSELAKLERLPEESKAAARPRHATA